jgi:hypothetical protein
MEGCGWPKRVIQWTSSGKCRRGGSETENGRKENEEKTEIIDSQRIGE